MNQQIIRMIRLLAHDMKIDVIAEGFGTPIHVEETRGQGDLFLKPVTSNEARMLIE